MPTRYAHTNLIAHDWKKLAAFYARAFGCEPLEPKRDLEGEWLAAGTQVPRAHVRGQHLRLPGFGEDGPTLEIFEYEETLAQAAPAANRAGFGHIAFRVDDVAAASRDVVDAGGSVFGEIVSRAIAGAGTLTFTYVRDPEGNLIELQSWS